MDQAANKGSAEPLPEVIDSGRTFQASVYELELTGRT
jgi:hypothetical protein